MRATRETTPRIDDGERSEVLMKVLTKNTGSSSRRTSIAVCVAGLFALAVTVVGSTAEASSEKLRDLVARADLANLSDGKPAQVTYRKGEVTVVHFWASWCPPCKKELPSIEEMAHSLEGRPVQFLAISIDSDRKNAQRFVKQRDIDLPLYHDKPQGLAEKLSIPYLPCTYVIDGDGNTVFCTTGSGEEQVARLRSELYSRTAPGQAGKGSE